MKKSNIYSAGKIIILWRVINFVVRFGEVGITIQDIVLALESSGFFGGTVPVKDSIRLGQKHDFLKIEEGKAIISDYTKKELLPFCQEDIPNKIVLRRILFQIISENKFHWLIFFNVDISLFKIAIPQEWIDLLETADLFKIDDENVICWWKELLQVFHDYDYEHLKDIGDFGEALTLEYEKRRLLEDGFENNGLTVTWVSRLSDSAGYDIRSKRGQLLQFKSIKEEPIQIEVKASVIPNRNQFRFMVSRNEWETALKNINTYFFYCWLGINLTTGNYSEGPIIIPVNRMKDLFPLDNHDSFQWTECRVNVDLDDYRI
jgi:hypothetical protein